MHRVIDAFWQAGSSRGRLAAVVPALFALAVVVPASALGATQTLTVKQAGTGTGTVTSSPAGIECGATCAAPFPEGETVVLTGAPGANTAAVQWAGCTKLNLENQCFVTMSAAKAITATFNLLERPLTVNKEGGGTGTVTSSPAGIDCGGTCSASFVKDSEVTLTGTPGAKTLPPDWTDCDSVEEDKCHVTMGKARSVTVRFDLSEYQLTVKKAGAGTGTVTSVPADIDCGATCAASFKTSSLVTLTGAPGANTDSVVQWSGCDSVDGAGKCLVTISADRTVTATFNLVQRQLKVVEVGTGTGTVTSSPGGVSCGATCQASFAHGTAVTLTGTAGLHSEAVKWFGCEAIVEVDKCKVTMSSAREVSAAFSLEPQYALYPVSVRIKGTGAGSVSSTPGGIACPGDCSETYVSKTSLTLVATPAAGSEFDHWSAKACGGSTLCTRTINGPRTINAVFVAVGTRTLTVSKAGTGSGVVTSKPAGIECGATCSTQIGAPTKVVLRAIPAVGSTFAGWSGEGCKGVRNCRVTMNEARNVTATFSKEVTPPPPGLLTVKSPIRVKGRKALLRVSCHKGPCRGTLRLIARVRNAKGRARRVQIGRSSVKLRAGVSSTLGMRLSRTGISLLRRAGRLRVQVVGGGTVPHQVKLSLRRR